MTLPWPGNVRELTNLIERLVLTADSDMIALDDLPADMSTVTTLAVGPMGPSARIHSGPLTDELAKRMIDGGEPFWRVARRGPIVSRERLGGLVKYCHRRAAQRAAEVARRQPFAIMVSRTPGSDTAEAMVVRDLQALVSEPVHPMLIDG